ncbi:MAG: PAS domain S-box protein [Magnetococcales bacterium]|nr:PAS domain S-box protein [Magnetococcales bacterium]
MSSITCVNPAASTLHEDPESLRSRLEEEITRRRQAEHALRLSETRFLGAFESAAHGMVLATPEGRFFQVNQAMCALLGYAEAELLATDFQSITHPDDLDTDLAFVRRALAGELPSFQMEKRYFHKAGHAVWVLLSVSLVRDYDGQPMHFVAHIQDISARKQAEMALLTTNEQLEMQVKCINRIQRLFIEESHPDAVFDALLLEILRLTSSVYGFIAELRSADEGNPFLQTLAISNIAWNEATKTYYETHAPSGLQFTRMHGLYAAPYLSGAPVIANDPANDPRRCGLPAGHPPLTAFLGVPIRRKKEIVGVLGIANRPQGYDEALVVFLEPLVATCAQIIEGYRNRRDRLETEERLRKSEQQLRESFLYARSLIEASLDPLVTISAEGKIMDVNRATEQVVRREREELIGTDFSDYFSDPDQAREGYRRVWQEGSVRDYPLSIKQEKGGLVEVLYNASLYRDQDGKTQGIFAAARDITLQKQVEKALQEHAKALQLRVRESECLREITHLSLTRGWSVDQMLEACVRRIPHGWRDAEHTCACIRVGERRFQTPNFRETPFRLSADIPLIEEKSGSVDVYYLGELPLEQPEPFCPEEKLLIESIANQLGQSLERLNTEEDLRLAKEQAEQAARAKSDFLSTMSHEIRTPINVVLGLTDVLLETELTPTQRRYIETMHHSGGALLGIINDVLDFSRIESGQFLLLDLPFCPAVLVDETARIMRMSAEQKNLTLITEIDDKLPESILGDDGRVRQIMINLIGNAVKFTERGQITVGLKRHPEAADRLLFFVADTGIGIAECFLEPIFDRFTQAESWTARRFGGTGLGLAISRRLAEMMGGRLWAESRLGEGSTFFFALPIREMEGEAMPSSPVASTPNAAGESLKILLAEDSPENQMLFLAYLEKTPHEVVVVNNGQEVVERVKRETFDLVLMDIEMPVLNGYEATRLIRQWELQENRAPLVILALSAHVMAGKRGESLAVGCQDHLTKPIRKQDLLQAIQNFGKRSKAE